MWKKIKFEELSSMALAYSVPFNKRNACGGPYIIKTEDGYFFNEEFEEVPAELGSYEWGYCYLKKDTDINQEKVRPSKVTGVELGLASATTVIREKREPRPHDKYLEEITGLKVTVRTDDKGNIYEFYNEIRNIFSSYSYTKALVFAKGYICGKNSTNKPSGD